MPRKLQNYLRTYRKHSGLSQDEMAFLLGYQSGTKVSRYERFARQPSLQVVLAYKIIFGVDARELFAGVFEDVERQTLRRVQLLTEKLSQARPSCLTDQKLAVLRAVTSGKASEPVKKK